MIKLRVRTRRAFLGGSGAIIGLPFLESILPRGQRARAAAIPRLLFYYTPNGYRMDAWTPTGVGTDYQPGRLQQPLIDKGLRGDYTLLTGLQNMACTSSGNHAGGTAGFLTCSKIPDSKDEDTQTIIRNSQSIDQVAAATLGSATRFPSLQMADPGGGTGCDTGYHCSYVYSISWSNPTTPNLNDTSPLAIFDKLFGGLDPEASVAERARRHLYRTSVLDYSLEEAQGLQGRMGQSDREELEKYLTGIRDLERRITLAAGSQCAVPERRDAGSYEARVRLLTDLMVTAFQCDATRVITFMLDHGGSNRSFPFIGVNLGHHQSSHHQMNPLLLDDWEKIDAWQVGMFGYLLEKMKAADDGGGATLLDNSAVFLSSEVSDGDRHNHDNMPVLLAGRAAGALTPGRHLIHRNVPTANLFLSMLHATGVNAPSFADSTGTIDDL